MIDEAVRSTVVWFPDWPIVVFGHPQTEPVAVFHANRVVAASAEARRYGVKRDLCRRESQGRCPSLEVFERDLLLEARVFEIVVASLDSLTPRVEIIRPGLVTFPTLGPSRYFGGDLPMAQRCVELAQGALGRLGSARVGIADGVFCASLAARCAADGDVLNVPAGGSPDFLAPFHVRALERPELTSVLVRLGLNTLGSLAELERGDFIARFGADGAQVHRLASGLDAQPLAVSALPLDMGVVIDLDPPINRVDQAVFLGKVLADQFLERLDHRGATCTRIVVTAETEHGDELVRYWRNEGALTADSVAERVRWQLDGWLNSQNKRPNGALIRLSIRPDNLVALKGCQLGFWGRQTEDAERASQVVARIQGQLGLQAVRVPERRGGRSPQEMVIAVQAHTVDLDRSDIDGRSSSASWPGALLGLAPIRIYGSALAAQVVDAQRDTVRVDSRMELSAKPYQMWIQDVGWQEIVNWAGPWPLDEHWWDYKRQRQCARFQVVVDDGSAHLLVIEAGRWWVEATYD